MFKLLLRIFFIKLCSFFLTKLYNLYENIVSSSLRHRRCDGQNYGIGPVRFFTPWPVGPKGVITSPSCTAARRQLTKILVKFSSSIKIIIFTRFLNSRYSSSRNSYLANITRSIVLRIFKSIMAASWSFLIHTNIRPLRQFFFYPRS